MRAGFPSARAGQCIGVLGGSFDPAHAGHVHITREALKRFGLDQVWWLVSPGNPLKAQGPAPMARRIAEASHVLKDPRVVVSDLEARLGTRYTAETLAALQQRYKGVRFTWLMGGDNLAGLHLWEQWPSILARVPVGVLARPDTPISARMARAARVFRYARLKPAQAPLLARAIAPAWCYIPIPMVDISSTEIRKSGAWARK
ncbi:MAG: nicotinate-nucleotide adenylyltransferase [Mangrovicoccus sp.]|nr:nicotinate-nucleotide adenylyltransferase [Mangrovicoccus sp.]